ncbi:hypothetical protein [Parageobacillus thermoglucosidasius]|uniref:Uncharacterized protein n=1 Tax=Parageobacillus thermoglucosidasius TaxID=1426 RepID=A0AAN0YPJ0_PARTM|nr:hypothetical protein [Parageobacillus thermoglucosidasius]AEH48648.1 hypothetical protein Geoth_2760 [Parageobacillus thermoglucosidasius C56-YS93]ALF10094.1 hypothetical protein AOT13_08785 [Parageobacillus thermoglucosidasius]ANZ30176.1 hypothetical protein BCV53_08795 [Parageobacillus thermoglucosidasius]APM80913.1 hypothetical protein BCV54_08800 [Parageobacillus thermoglucosidasius]KJX70629.1 YD repeat protein [Parageobacillus thermoglucosidasius]
MIEAFVAEIAKKEIGSSLKDIPIFVKDLNATVVLNYAEADKPLYEQEMSKKDIIDLNRKNGDLREEQVYERLKEMYPEQQGYKIIREAYLRDAEGNIVKDDVTGQARRIDFVVVKDGVVIDSIEVTSETATKEAQLAKEQRIRESGGNYIKDPETGEIYEFSPQIQTHVWRLA